MTLLVSALWPGLAASLVLGLLAGALGGLPRGRVALLSAGLPVLGLAALSLLALTGTVAGRTGFWIEAGALILGAYLAGCVIGGAGRALRDQRS